MKLMIILTLGLVTTACSTRKAYYTEETLTKMVKDFNEIKTHGGINGKKGGAVNYITIAFPER